MAKEKAEKWRITAKNGVVLGIFEGTQLQAWQKCCKALGFKDDDKTPVTKIEPGLKFSKVDPREWKPTHVIVNGTARIEVAAQVSDGHPDLTLLFTRDEWLSHELNHWDLFHGKLRRDGKESSFAHLEKKS